MVVDLAHGSRPHPLQLVEDGVYSRGEDCAKGITIEEEIGKTAGAIWDALNTRSEQSLSELKIAVKGKEPTFDWAIEWLARENQIAITPEKRSFRMPVRIAEVCLAEPAITPFAILGGDNHARLAPGRNAQAEYPARLIFFFAWSFSSADAIPKAQPY